MQDRTLAALTLLAIIAVYAMALSAALTMYGLGGADWDFIAHWLYAKSLVTPAFYSALLGGHLGASIEYGNMFYFETLRAPLTGVLMVPFVYLGGNAAIPYYLAFAILILLIAALRLSRTLKADPLLMALAFLTPYTALFLLLLNGTEIISTALLLVSVCLLLEKDWKTGVMLALAALAKYPNLIFVPLLFLLPKGARKKALAGFALTTVPWLLFNALVFGNPVFSYALSIGAFNTGGTAAYFPLGVIGWSLWLILPDLAPFLLALAALVLVKYKGRTAPAINKGRLWGAYRYRVLVSFLALGALAWAITSARGSPDDLPRLGYLVYTGAALLLVAGISDTVASTGIRKAGRYVLMPLFFAMALLLLTWAQYHGYLFYGSSNPVLAASENAMAAANISNCNIVSNNWVYLIYLGYKAHFPYYYNSTVQRYPIVFFTDLGSNRSVRNFANVTRRIYSGNLLIAFPRNYTC